MKVKELQCCVTGMLQCHQLFGYSEPLGLTKFSYLRILECLQQRCLNQIIRANIHQAFQRKTSVPLEQNYVDAKMKPHTSEN